MARRLFVVFVIVAVLLSAGGISSAAPRLSDWSAPTWMGTTLNSVAADNGPALSKDGLTLYFTSTRTGGAGGEDIWVSYRATSTSTAWTSPVNLTPLNTSLNDRVPALSRDGHRMFFAHGLPTNLDLWVSYREHTHEDFGPFGWQTPTPIASLNSTANDVAPAYCEDASGIGHLFFASNRSGGHGDFDIYEAVEQPDGSFDGVTNVAALNTSAQDARPTVSHNCLEIVFHSDRGTPFDIDLYSSSRGDTNEAWSTPERLDSLSAVGPVDAQPTLSADGLALIFASTRAGGAGAGDLWMSTRVKATGKP